ncbi:MAG: hypothetical protein UEC12_07430 [Lachnospiraceae bacterium]|nr:hypothetical protein [Lachnospiraceae bacterium]
MEKTGWKGKLVSVIPEGRAGLVLMMLAAALLSACAFEGYRLDEHAREGSYDAASVAGEGRGQHQTAYFRIQINASPRAEKGEKLPFFIGNPEENTEDVQVRIFLDETGEELYCSPVLHPGERQVYGEARRELEPGEYKATAVFYILDQEGQEIGSMEAAVTVTVEGADRPE